MLKAFYLTDNQPKATANITATALRRLHDLWSAARGGFGCSKISGPRPHLLDLVARNSDVPEYTRSHYS